MVSARTVLVVEDDEALRGLICRLLDSQDYNVLCSGTAMEAIQLASDPTERADLLLTDLGLPGASGYQLAGVLLQLQPELKVIIMSGYAEADIQEPPPGGRRLPHLVKPFAFEDLLRLVRKLLEPSAAPSVDVG